MAGRHSRPPCDAVESWRACAEISVTLSLYGCIPWVGGSVLVRLFFFVYFVGFSFRAFRGLAFFVQPRERPGNTHLLQYGR